jgi:hypothetical protein
VREEEASRRFYQMAGAGKLTGWRGSGATAVRMSFSRSFLSIEFTILPFRGIVTVWSESQQACAM